ncbi:SDR family oxidoreductase [Deinococcus sp.]|uniref:SDR family oxidoreductase n=1 Tax=Deinococcus sp. TaxID=47478 RepID=UPI003C7E0366
MHNILVVGASGFVGRHLVRALLTDGHAVHGFARTPAKVADLETLGCEVVQGDITNAASIHRALAGMDTAYISVHTLSPQGASSASQGFMDVEMQGLQHIVAACRTHDVRRVIYLTSLGNVPDSRSEWARERWKTEQFLLDSGLDVTVLQPGQIVGVGGTGFDMMLSQAKRSPAVMLANGKQKWRNIALGDLLYYLVGVLDDPRSYGQRYEVGGDDVLTNDQMLDTAADLLGRTPPAKIHLPRRLLGVIAPVIERLGRLPRGAFRGLIDGMDSEMIGDPSAIQQLLPRPPLSYRQAVERALSVQGT